MQYIHWLLIISAVFIVAERLRPTRRGQPFFRRQLLNDVFYLFFNGHFYAVVVGGGVAWFALRTNGVLSELSIYPEKGWLSGRSFASQFLIYMLATDFMQWCIHNLLHRVPALWSIHKVHHSIHTMDWIGNWRFHWAEIVVYRSIQYLPVLYLGGDGAPLLAVAVFGTAWGNFNHSNINLGIGPLAYVFNSPRMHLWHHDASDEGGVAKNFGIVLSVWDWLFRTAYWPRERPPGRIGYPGDTEMPRDVPRQMIFPVSRGETQNTV